MAQLRLFKSSPRERRNEGVCSLCHGHRRLCGKPLCPILVKAETLIDMDRILNRTNFFGSSPPAAFVGSWGYPRVLAGPMVPPLEWEDTSVMDSPELWLGRTIDEILRYRFSLVRGKASVDVKSAANPPKLLSVVQEAVMSSRPVDTEVWLRKRPNLRILFSPRAAPVGPSAPIERAALAENPHVPRRVDQVVSDTGLKAVPAVVDLYGAGVAQRQIVRMLSVGLLGVKEHRRLVPTEWSITAIDDILGRSLRREVLKHPQINEFYVFGHKAFGNNVQVLLIPSPWMFEALEAWLTSVYPAPVSDYELARGRKTYPISLAGAYHASRLPVLEYLSRIRRQAGALVFMEVSREWIPLGVWRFREICREALRRGALRFSTLEESLGELGRRLDLPMGRWVESSRLIRFYREQRRIDGYPPM